MTRVKITDVAKAAGVSPATVSYVLSGKRPISEATKLRVCKTIEKLGYRPNQDARALKSSTYKTIGVLAMDFSEVSVSEIILSIEQVACRNEYHIYFVSGMEFDYDVKDALAFLLRRSLDGVIILFGITSDQPVGSIGDVDIPLASINRPISEEHPCILPDNYDGGYRAAAHLVGAGCTRIGLISGPDVRFSSRERVRGFTEGLKDSGRRLYKKLTYTGDFNFDSGGEGLVRLLDLNPDMDGLFCANDMMAAGAVTEAGKLGVPVPDRLKIIGFDNRDFSGLWPVPFSTFTAPFKEMGRAGVNILLSMIREDTYEPGISYIKNALVPRRSTEH